MHLVRIEPIGIWLSNFLSRSDDCFDQGKLFCSLHQGYMQMALTEKLRIRHVLYLCMGHRVAQLVEALCYKPEGRRFDSQWCHWNFSLTSIWSHYGPGVESASNRNEYQEYILGGKGGRCIGLTTLPPSCADCLEIWEPQPPGTLRACPGL